MLAGIYVKGMKMPESCGECIFRVRMNPEEAICKADGHLFEETLGTLLSRRDKTCPMIPAADVRPVVRGKWIEQEEWTGVEAFGFKEMTVGSFKCSVCGFEVDISEGEFHYCPNCGALMDKDGDGDV